MKNDAEEPVYVTQGDPGGCRIPECPPLDPVSPDTLLRPYVTAARSGNVGANLYIEKRLSAAVTLSLLLKERSTGEQTTVEVVRPVELRTGTCSVLNIAVEPSSRALLRIYDPYNQQASVWAEVFSSDDRRLLYEGSLPLVSEIPTGSESGFFDYPAVGVLDLTAALSAVEASNVYVRLRPLSPGLRYWALVSLTENVTQHVTLLTPQ